MLETSIFKIVFHEIYRRLFIPENRAFFNLPANTAFFVLEFYSY